jgi:ketosteroid isomerase-like protein
VSVLARRFGRYAPNLMIKVPKPDTPLGAIFRNSGMKVRLHGHAAIATGVTTVKGTAAGKPFHAELQFTDTLVRRNGEWTIAASHVSPAPKP